MMDSVESQIHEAWATEKEILDVIYKVYMCYPFLRQLPATCLLISCFILVISRPNSGFKFGKIPGTAMPMVSTESLRSIGKKSACCPLHRKYAMLVH